MRCGRKWLNEQKRCRKSRCSVAGSRHDAHGGFFIGWSREKRIQVLENRL